MMMMRNHWRSIVAKQRSIVTTSHFTPIPIRHKSSSQSTGQQQQHGSGGDDGESGVGSIVQNVMNRIFRSKNKDTSDDEQKHRSSDDDQQQHQQQHEHIQHQHSGHGEPLDSESEYSQFSHGGIPPPSPVPKRHIPQEEIERLTAEREKLEKEFNLHELANMKPHSDMSQQFDRVPMPEMEPIVPVLHLREDSEVRVTTIDTPHGPLRVGTVDTHAKMSTLVLMFEAGIRYEQRKLNEHGLSLVLNKLSFKESENFSEQRLAELHDRIIYLSTVDQETTTYSCDFYRERLPEAVELLADTISRPILKQEEIDSVLENLKLSCEEQRDNPIHSSVLTDYMLESCYGEDQGLGHATLNITDKVDREALLRYTRKFFRPEKAVVVGVGVDHDQFVQCVREQMTFSHLDKGSKAETDVLVRDASKVIEEEKSKWIGGMKTLQFTEPPSDIYKMDLPSLTSFVMSFEGCSLYDDDIFTIHLLETMLGGGDSFSAGGPGKGIMSIINIHYLPRFRLYNMMCRHYAFKDTGIFCIHASEFHDSAKYTLDATLSMFSELHRRMKEEDLERAKNRLLSSLLITMEDGASLAQNIAADLLLLNKFRGTDYLAEKIRAVTMKDIERVILRILSSKPAVTAIGDVQWLPPKYVIDAAISRLSNRYQQIYGGAENQNQQEAKLE